MGHWIGIETPHGPVRAWRADPGAPSRAGVLVIQEIFGVNAHIRSVADRLAQAGFVALAPALFDPVEHGVELDYDAAGIERGRALVGALGVERGLDVLDAAAETLQMEGLRIGAVGFCWGGTFAYLCSTRLALPAVDYYGARSAPFLDEPPKAPLLCHFGARDASIPPDVVARHRARAETRVFEYAGAGHAFNRDVDPSAYDAESAALAWRRTLDFLSEHLR